jgi:hypothetical protein
MTGGSNWPPVEATASDRGACFRIEFAGFGNLQFFLRLDHLCLVCAKYLFLGSRLFVRGRGLIV